MASPSAFSSQIIHDLLARSVDELAFNDGVLAVLDVAQLQSQHHATLQHVAAFVLAQSEHMRGFMCYAFALPQGVNEQRQVQTAWLEVGRALAACSQLTHIAVCGCGLGDEAAAAFADALLNNPRLDRVEFNNNPFTVEGVLKLLDAASRHDHPHVRGVVSVCGVDLGGIDGVRQLWDSKAMRHTLSTGLLQVNMREVGGLDGAGVEHIVDSLIRHQSAAAVASAAGDHEEKFSAGSEAKADKHKKKREVPESTTTQLQMVSFSDNAAIGDVGGKAVARLVASGLFPALQRVEMARCGLGYEAVKEIVSAVQNGANRHQVDYCDLSGSLPGADGIEAIARIIESVGRVYNVALGDVDLSDAQTARLAKAIVVRACTELPPYRGRMANAEAHAVTHLLPPSAAEARKQNMFGFGVSTFVRESLSAAQRQALLNRLATT